MGRVLNPFERLVRRIGSRRLIYLSMLLAVAVPMVWRISFKELASPMVRDVYRVVETLPTGARVLLVFDFDPASASEVEPMSDAFVRHLALRGARIYCLTLWPTGPAEIDRVVRKVLLPEFPAYAYGEDYVDLGFMSGNEGVIAVTLTDFKKAFSTDAHNLSTYDEQKLPMMRPIEDLTSFDLIIDVSGGYPGLREWIQYGSGPAGVPLVGASVAVGAPEIFPYVPDQCLGLLAGLKGAAEYEQLLVERYPQLERPECRAALERMGPQTAAHLLIISLIMVGNGIHVARRRAARRRRQGGES